MAQLNQRIKIRDVPNVLTLADITVLLIIYLNVAKL
jgi:hypothetical protein